jgi:hypothetical protein
MNPGSPQAPAKLIRKRLDDAGVEAYFASLAGATELELRVKGTALAHSDAATELAVVAAQLRSGAVLAVQLRFALDGMWWCDTVVRKGDTYRLVRMEQEFPPEPGGSPGPPAGP